MVTSKETRAVNVALHQNGFTGKDHLSNHQELQGEWFNCSEEGFSVPKTVKQASGLSPKEDAATRSGHHQCRACSGMAEGRILNNASQSVCFASNPSAATPYRLLSTPIKYNSPQQRHPDTTTIHS
ncbi:hypothetical protein SRHO_G00124930 [Serrasalmus rhombeus]